MKFYFRRGFEYAFSQTEDGQFFVQVRRTKEVVKVDEDFYWEFKRMIEAEVSKARNRELISRRKENRICFSSLDEPVGKETTVGDFISDPADLELKKTVRELVCKLKEYCNDFEWKIFSLRYLYGLTQTETAEKLSIPRSTLSYRERQLMEKIRKEFKDFSPY